MALHRIAARLRFLLNVKAYGWAARGELQRYAARDAGWHSSRDGRYRPRAAIQTSGHMGRSYSENDGDVRAP